MKTQCNNDTILVEWEMTEDSPLYLVTAEGHDQSLISCNSSASSCLLQDVRCGMHYSVIVSASSDKCSSLRSPPAKITTGSVFVCLNKQKMLIKQHKILLTL